MSTYPSDVWEPSSDRHTATGALYSDAARDHLWMHFTRHSTFEETGPGPHRADHHPRQGLEDLGRPRQRVHRRPRRPVRRPASATAARRSPRRRPSRPRSSPSSRCGPTRTPGPSSSPSGSPHNAPGDLNRVFFTTGGGEAVETAWKLAKQYFKLTGKPTKHKVISRAVAYHGTPQGALSITGIPAAKETFEPLVPGAPQGAQHQHVPRPRAPARRREGLRPLGRRPHRRGHRVRGPRLGRGRLPRAGAELRRLLPAAGRLLRAGPRDLRRVRRAARLRRGRSAPSAGSARCSRARTSATSPTSSPCAKGMTSGYSPLGAMIASDRLFEPFTPRHHLLPARLHLRRAPGLVRRGAWPTSTSSSARASTTGSRRTPRSSRRPSTSCSTCRSSATCAAPATSTASSWSRTRRPARRSTTPRAERLLRGFLSKALFDAGLYCRADDRGDPVVQLAPPLIMGPTEFDEIERRLRSVLTEAENHL